MLVQWILNLNLTLFWPVIIMKTFIQSVYLSLNGVWLVAKVCGLMSTMSSSSQYTKSSCALKDTWVLIPKTCYSVDKKR